MNPRSAKPANLYNQPTLKNDAKSVIYFCHRKGSTS